MSKKQSKPAAVNLFTEFKTAELYYGGQLFEVNVALESEHRSETLFAFEVKPGWYQAVSLSTGCPAGPDQWGATPEAAIQVFIQRWGSVGFPDLKELFATLDLPKNWKEPRKTLRSVDAPIETHFEWLNDSPKKVEH